MENKDLVLWIAIGILAVLVVYVVFFRASSTGNSVNANGQIDTTDWTENEIMNYEMHGVIPARFQGQTAAGSSGTGMVGGC